MSDHQGVEQRWPEEIHVVQSTEHRHLSSFVLMDLPEDVPGFESCPYAPAQRLTEAEEERDEARRYENRTSLVREKEQAESQLSALRRALEEAHADLLKRADFCRELAEGCREPLFGVRIAKATTYEHAAEIVADRSNLDASEPEQAARENSPVGEAQSSSSSNPGDQPEGEESG